MRPNRFKIAVALGMLLPLCAGGDGQERKKGSDESEELTINEIMEQAHARGRAAKKALNQKVASGSATDEEKKRLLELYEALARAKPNKGSLVDWKRDTAAMVEAARAAVKGEEKAAEKLLTAVNCKYCHDKYQPLYALDGTIVAERGFFALSSPPEFVMVANISKDRSKLTIYSSTIVSSIVHKEVEVVQDGKKRTEKVPEMQYQREVAETVVAVAAIRVLDTEGNELDGEELWKRLTLGSVVLRVADSRLPAAEYLKLLADDALVIVPRAR